MKNRVCLFLISICAAGLIASGVTSCTGRQTLSHEEQVFLHYMDVMGQTIPQEPHTFILVPNEACTGCKILSLLYAVIDESDTVTFFTTVRQKEEKTLPDRPCIVIDSAGNIGKLNWKYHNITEIHTADGKIDWMRSYEADEVIDRFEWVIDAVDTLDVRTLMVC